LKDFPRAAEFFLKLGDFSAAVESRLDAKDAADFAWEKGMIRRHFAIEFEW
jgi:hypothetical protein